MASYSWSSLTGVNWGDAGNWIPNGVPGSADQAPIDPDRSYVDTLDGVTPSGPPDLDAAGPGLAIADDTGHAGTGPAQALDASAGGTLTFIGNQTLDDFNVSLGDSSIDIAGTLTLGPASTLTVVGQESFGPPSLSYPFQDDVLDNKGTIIVAAGGGVAGSGDEYSAGYMVENEGLAAFGGDTSSRLYQLTNSGTLSVSGAASLTIESLSNSGIVQVSNDANLSISALEGDHYLVGQLTNTGTITIGSGGTVTLEDGSSQLGTVSFADGTGTLVLTDLGYTQIVHYVGQLGNSGTLNLFQNGDVLDLGDQGYNPISNLPPPGPYSIQHSGNTLTVFEGSTVFDSLTLTGQDYTNATFTLTGDIVTTDAPCFCAGTLILTDRGERAVESLEVGDLVVTLRDGVETLMPVRWLGRRRVVVAQHPEPEHVDPVRIMRDAVAPGVPARDLFVSPDHALHLDGMLVQARQLVNHMTITHDGGRTVVTYHHVELDRHAVLIADGMPCESYLDGGNRGQFDAHGTLVPLHPPVVADAQPCAPLAKSAVLVRSIWQRLMERARTAGYVAPTVELKPDQMPWLETADGVRLAPCGDGLRFALPPGCLRVRLRSPSDRPTTLSPWSDDRRRLGVAINALTLHQGRWRQDIALAGLDGDAGWWPLETADDLAWRWTDGDASIDLPEPAEAIEVILHATMPIPVSLDAGRSRGHAKAG